ncbi:MAG: class I SAM-dependent methyltransferase [Anaerolineae bacterium]
MSLLAEQEMYWDSVSEKKEFTLPLQMGEFEKVVSREMAILDVGCGYGRTLKGLHDAGFENLFGVDYAQGMIDRGQRLHPYLDLRKNDGSVLPFEDGTFDAVILIAVLTCIAESEGQRGLISEIERVLKDSGILYINDYLLNADQRNIERYDRAKEKYGVYGIFELPEGAVVRHHTPEHIVDITSGFARLVFETVVYTTMNGNKSNGFYYIGRKHT